MTTVYLENRSLYRKTNVVKKGHAHDSCDSDLVILGRFTLEPNQKLEIDRVNETTDFFWKSPTCSYWTHGTVWEFDDEEALSIDTCEGTGEIDICNQYFSLSDYGGLTMGRNTVENRELIEIARNWLNQSEPSSEPPGSWRLTSKNSMFGNRNGKPWLYTELQRRNHDNGWRANLREVNLNKSYSNNDGNLIED